MQYASMTASGLNAFFNTNARCLRYFSLLVRLYAHAGYQIEDIQQEWVQLTMEGDEPYTISVWGELSAF